MRRCGNTTARVIMNENLVALLLVVALVAAVWSALRWAKGK